jgi:hypothetical protein
MFQPFTVALTAASLLALTPCFKTFAGEFAGTDRGKGSLR